MNQKKQEKNFAILYSLNGKIRLLILLLLVLLSLVVVIAFSETDKATFRENMRTQNDALVDNVATFYELIVENTNDLSNKIILYDISSVSFYESITSGTIPTEMRSRLFDFLTGISVTNEYIYSVYFYDVSRDVMYSTLSMPTATSKKDEFYDSSIFDEFTDDSFIEITPRILNSSSGFGLVQPNLFMFSITRKLTIEDDVFFLVVNINAETVYNSIQREMELLNADSTDLYITDKNDIILYSGDETELLTEFDMSAFNQGDIISDTYSGALECNFVLKQSIDPVSFNINSAVFIIIIVFSVLLLATYFIIEFIVLPLKKKVVETNELRWKSMLLSSDRSEEYEKLVLDDNIIKGEAFVIVSLRSVKEFGEFSSIVTSYFYQKTDDERFDFQVIHMPDDGISLVVSIKKYDFDNVKYLDMVHTVLNDFLTSMSLEHLHNVECGVGRIKTSLSTISESYRESLETFEYSYTLNSQIRIYFNIDKLSKEYIFPSQLSSQMLNQLIVGNLKSCINITDLIFRSFNSSDYILSNDKIIQTLYFMHNIILSHIATLPVPIKIQNDIDYNNCSSLEKLYDAFINFIEDIVNQINALDDNSQAASFAEILSYTHEHFCDNEICLDVVAESCNVATSFVSKVVKECTGMNFPAYITYLRIEKAKLLLEENTMTVNQISEEVGYTYPYYFVKKFKSLEGVTPGQYFQKK